MQSLVNNRKLLVIVLPIAVVIPLLIASWSIGPTSILFWIGVGLTMLFGWGYKKARQ